MQFHGSKKMTLGKTWFAAAALAATNLANAGTLNGGVFNIAFNDPNDLLAGLNLGEGSITSYYVANFFDKAVADTLTANDMVATPTNTYPAPNILSYDVNPSSLAGTGIPTGYIGGSGRSNQATTLTWASDQDHLLNASSLTASGQVGLDGVYMTRGSFTGTLLSGDYKFSYIAARNNGTNTGWTLTNNVSFASNTFDTRNISITTDGDSLAFTGELWWSPNTSAFLFGGDGSNSAGMAGTFSLISPVPAAVPLPAAAWLFGSGLFGVLASRRRKSAPLAA